MQEEIEKEVSADKGQGDGEDLGEGDIEVKKENVGTNVGERVSRRKEKK